METPVSREKNNLNSKTILLAIIGLIFIALYFVLTIHSPAIRLIKPHIPKEEILSKAESFFNQLLADPTGFEREITPEIDLNLLRYVQYHKKKYHRYPGLIIGGWEVVWREKKADQSPYVFKIKFDFDGTLLGFHIAKKNFVLEDTSKLSEDDAVMEAKYFLESLNIKTQSLITTNRDIKKTNDSTTYKFTLKDKTNPYPHVTNTYIFEYVGYRIVSYQWNRIVDLKTIGQTNHVVESAISVIMMIIVWLTIIGIIFVSFIKKLRKDELEFKRAIWMGIVTAVLLIIMISVVSQIEWEGLIGGVVSGLLAFIGILILFPSAESCIREAWPEKLEVMDLLFQGKGAVQETGASILHAFFLTGVTVFFFGGLIFLVTSLDVGYLVLKHHMIEIFHNLPNAIHYVFEKAVSSIFIGFVFIGFWSGYLKKKIPTNRFLFVFLLALSFNLGGIHRLNFHPPYLGFILVLPITLLWAFFVRKWDMFTVLLSLFGVLFFLDLMLIPLIPDNFFSLPGMAVSIFVGLFFLLGVYLLYRPQSVKDYDSYIPDYVSRIAERERFLKELEIARGVQMRFLPQKVPEFPSLEIVSLCQPAMEVGGDYYDFIRIDDRYMSVLIGDVSGKGVSAAFYMTMVKGIIKTLSKKIKAPASLLVEANEIFYENAPRNVFITIIYGIFDLQEQTLTVASAGHNPLIVRRQRSGGIEIVNPKGIALGLDSGEHYRSIIQEKCIPIFENDVLVFYTDGVSEAMNTDKEIFGEERLYEIIKKFAYLSPQQLQQKIVKAVSEFSGKAPQHDDFTMVVIKVRPIS
jgi:hypothetical protein